MIAPVGKRRQPSSLRLDGPLGPPNHSLIAVGRTNDGLHDMMILLIYDVVVSS
jgi:hypothetical protein